jgi:hypothetical protein
VKASCALWCFGLWSNGSPEPLKWPKRSLGRLRSFEKAFRTRSYYSATYNERRKKGGLGSRMAMHIANEVKALQEPSQMLTGIVE